jgi:hypothetical protein
MYGPTLEDQRQHERFSGSWKSPWYPVVFGVAIGVELVLWWRAPFMRLGWQAALALTVVLASVPWVGSVSHRADSEALRRHGARFAFLVPAVLLHAGMAYLYGPYGRSGPGDSSVSVNRVLLALRDPERMSLLMVEAGGRPADARRDLGFFLRLGADPNRPAADGRFPLDAARSAGAVDALLAGGARKHSPAIAVTLRFLASEGDAETLRRLLAVGVPPDTLEPGEQDGFTAAHEAAYSDHAEALRVLLAAGADPSRRDRWGRDAADNARRGNSGQALAVLAERSAASGPR